MLYTLQHPLFYQRNAGDVHKKKEGFYDRNRQI